MYAIETRRGTSFGGSAQLLAGSCRALTSSILRPLPHRLPAGSLAPTFRMLQTAWTRRAQSFRSPSWSSFRGLYAANTEARILSSFRPSFKAGFSTLRSVSSPSSPGVSLFARRSLLSKFTYRNTFDPRFFSSKASESVAADLPILSPPPVGLWLLGSSVLVFAVIVVGGVTRLTESGLSITEWRPVTGILPPLSRAEWEAEFDKYKLTPEFKLYVSTLRYHSIPNQ